MAKGPKIQAQRSVAGKQSILRTLTPAFLKPRAALYVDGFNLHHAILETGRRDLLWLDLHRLGGLLAGPSHRLAETVWTSAHKPDREPRMRALFAYEQALRARKVRCLMGHFVVYRDGCNACGHTWSRGTEKQSDVNLALSLAADAHADRFDVAYLLTTDGDHAATARFLRETAPRKRLINVVPPGRRANRQISTWSDEIVTLDTATLEAALLPERMRVGKTRWIERPVAWAGGRDPTLRPERDPDPSPPARGGHLKLVVSN